MFRRCLAETLKRAVDVTRPRPRAVGMCPQEEPALRRGGTAKEMLWAAASAEERMKLQPEGLGRKNVNFLRNNSEYVTDIMSRQKEGIYEIVYYLDTSH